MTTPIERAANYSAAFPKYPPLAADDRWLYGIWMMGNNYRGSGYYGAYPPGYIPRVMALFPEAKSVLHLFSGSLAKGPYVRFDVRPDVDSDVRGDAHHLDNYFDLNSFDLILADPPYSVEDAQRYGPPMVDRKQVLTGCTRILRPGGNLVWLDQVLPMYRKSELHLWGLIGLVRSTNHRFRVATFFGKVGSHRKRSEATPANASPVQPRKKRSRESQSRANEE